jgi:hypothetical protein
MNQKTNSNTHNRLIVGSIPTEPTSEAKFSKPQKNLSKTRRLSTKLAICPALI